MKKIIVLLVASLLSATSFAQEKWNVDTYHSFLNFSVKHLGISFVDGRFDQFNGSFNGTPEDITKGNFNFTVETKSVNTSIEMRDNHLKTDDFFAVENHPTMTFKSTSIKKFGKDKYKLEGLLTIREITKPVTFELTYGGLLKDDGQGNTKIGFQAKTSINRFDFGLAYDPTASGIGKDVKINVNLEFSKVK
ncbi:YceI family protein [Myroides pelagicus]|uniref:Polyisoprenoid-binding protein n=1 Tax=Myroides pelagicus TaxID=270914 RepID=A0A7K1GLG3_9FLAO|nr:YceI family protein [Myroides pelagicus]MEC4112710.1 YceI family protein [Myroides pelagicus]MTH29697.1 polyisoprenoid-binding protein [Myroides pelagicus]